MLQTSEYTCSIIHCSRNAYFLYRSVHHHLPGNPLNGYTCGMVFQTLCRQQDELFAVIGAMFNQKGAGVFELVKLFIAQVY